MSSLLEARGVAREFIDGDRRLEVLSAVDLEVQRGETLVIVGASGAGKSTLLHILGALDRPTAGSVLLNGEELVGGSDRRLAQVRSRSVGFVFQLHHLLPEFDALENVALPLLAQGVDVAAADRRAGAILERVGLDERLHHSPMKLSGGEQQRVAIARALVKEPELVLLDEPTGNLDRETGNRVLDLLFALAAENGAGFVIVSHDRALARRADRALLLRDGVLHPLDP
jgi:lipoprotein-releasing system ATP-binding protein